VASPLVICNLGTMRVENPLPPFQLYRNNTLSFLFFICLLFLSRIGPGKYDYKINLKGSGTLKDAPPYGIVMYKGYKNVALTRNTVDFVINHPIAAAFQSWLVDTLIPDEHYYSTLVRIKGLNPDTHDVVVMDNSTDTTKGLCPRFSHWRKKDPCAGEFIRDICNFSFGDLWDIWKSDCWVANKFNLAVDSNAVMCHAKHIMELNKY
jgi:hypothetical protein